MSTIQETEVCASGVTPLASGRSMHKQSVPRLAPVGLTLRAIFVARLIRILTPARVSY